MDGRGRGSLTAVIVAILEKGVGSRVKSVAGYGAVGVEWKNAGLAVVAEKELGCEDGDEEGREAGGLKLVWWHGGRIDTGV
jgi:hypothetical protein